MWRIVDTDNFGGDYPNERFVEGEFETAWKAQMEADQLNLSGGQHAPRYYKVVEMPYELAPGFEP